MAYVKLLLGIGTLGKISKIQLFHIGAEDLCE